MKGDEEQAIQLEAPFKQVNEEANVMMLNDIIFWAYQEKIKYFTIMFVWNKHKTNRF